jgi:hypothetical protein
MPGSGKVDWLQKTPSGHTALRIGRSKLDVGNGLPAERWLRLWDASDAQVPCWVQIEPEWNPAAQAAPGYEVDQRTINW